jgi:hypothetical protein
MEEGHALSSDNSGKLSAASWIEGPAEKGGLFGYRVKGKRRLPIVSWRCPRCGWLLWFAPEKDS